MHHKHTYPIIGFAVSLLLLPLVSQAAYNWRTSFATATKTNEIAIGETLRAVSDTRINFDGVSAKKPKQSVGNKTKWSVAAHSEVVRQRIDETTYASNSNVVLNNLSIDTTTYVGKEKSTATHNYSDIIRLRTITKDGASYVQIADMSRDVCKLVSSLALPCSSVLGQWMRIEEISSLTESPLTRLAAPSATDVDEEKLKKLSENEKLKKIPVLQPLRLVKTFKNEDGATFAVIESKISQTFVNTAIAEYRKTMGTQDSVSKAQMNEAIRHINTIVAQSRILTTINTETNTVTTVEVKGKLSGTFYDFEAIYNKARKITGAKRVLQGTGKIELFNTSTVERNVFEEITTPEVSRTPEEFMNYLEQEIQAAQDTDSDRLYDADEMRFFGTDPNKVDSDDDGYDDREEMVKGYNPNGEGR